MSGDGVDVSVGELPDSACLLGQPMEGVCKHGEVPGEPQVVRHFLAELGLENHWSEGSTYHLQNRCRPCHYWHTLGGCTKGSACRFCHLPHAKATDAKTKRDMCRRLAAAIEDQQSERGIDILATRSKFLRGLLEQRMRGTPSVARDARDPTHLCGVARPLKWSL
mmetsp:Transcript_13215/g.38084  ORF Transcript_13215/g.38084 Transcript_13215/m.38084 type:complete len:165 (+) Transcript_13215:169-663(+)